MQKKESDSKESSNATDLVEEKIMSDYSTNAIKSDQILYKIKSGFLFKFKTLAWGILSMVIPLIIFLNARKAGLWQIVLGVFMGGFGLYNFYKFFREMRIGYTAAILTAGIVIPLARYSDAVTFIPWHLLNGIKYEEINHSAKITLKTFKGEFEITDDFFLVSDLEKMYQKIAQLTH